MASRRSLEVDTYTRKAGGRPIEDALATVGVRKRWEEAIEIVREKGEMCGGGSAGTDEAVVGGMKVWSPV